MKELAVKRLIEGYQHANKVGWKTYYTRVWNRLEHQNYSVHLLLEEYVKETAAEIGFEESEIDFVKEVVAIVLSCVDFLNRINERTVEEISDGIFFTKSEDEVRDALYDDADEGKETTESREACSDKPWKLDQEFDEEIFELIADKTEDECYRQRDARRKKVFRRGRQQLLRCNRTFYLELLKFINSLSQQNLMLREFMVNAVDLIFAILAQHEENRKIDKQFKGICSQIGGQ